MSLFRPSRRRLLTGLAAGAGCLALPGRRARAGSVSASDRRFLFVQVLGGWDPTRVFAPLFDAEAVAMESDAQLSMVGDIPYVEHAARPSVKAFLEAYGEGLAVLNGVYVPSISHHSATRLMLTGVVDGAYADWGTRIAKAHAEAHIVPYLVAGGANFAGKYGVDVGRAGSNGQLPGLATGELMLQSDTTTTLPSSAGSSLVDQFLASAASSRQITEANTARAALLESYHTALSRAAQLKQVASEIDLSTDTSIDGQLSLALRVLSNGISRCASVSYPTSDSAVAWDTHAANDVKQGPLWEGLFAALLDLAALLEETPGQVAATLAEETVVVVLSEMGRTPNLNASGGKDHWPYTTALLLGAGVAGGRVVGAYDDGLYGKKVDLASGELDEGGTALGNDVLGATILQLAGLDPADEDIGAEALAAVIA